MDANAAVPHVVNLLSAYLLRCPAIPPCPAASVDACIGRSSWNGVGYVCVIGVLCGVIGYLIGRNEQNGRSQLSGGRAVHAAATSRRSVAHGVAVRPRGQFGMDGFDAGW